MRFLRTGIRDYRVFLKKNRLIFLSTGFGFDCYDLYWGTRIGTR